MSLVEDKEKLQNRLDHLVSSIQNDMMSDLVCVIYDRADLLSYFASCQLKLDYWKYLYILTLRQWGFNIASANMLYEWGSYGHNWTRLHFSVEELATPLDNAYRDFYNEVDYCSDRMSLDRLFRCHWLYHLCLELGKLQRAPHG